MKFYKYKKATPAEIEEAVAWIRREPREILFEFGKYEAYRDNHRYSDQPALFFEEHTGFSGIAGRYRFPAEFNRVALDKEALEIHEELIDIRDKVDQKLLSQEDLEEISAKALRTLTTRMNKLKLLNSLDGLIYNADDPYQLCEVIQGIASGYNIDDINYYINVINPAANAMSSVGTPAELEMALCAHSPVIDANIKQERKLNIDLARYGFGYKGMIEWKPAPATLDKIEQQLNALKSRGGGNRR